MKSYQQFKTHIFAGIAKNQSRLAALNNDLAAHPETSGEEYESSQKIVRLLESYGYQAEYPFAGLDTAFKAVYGSDGHTHKAAILVEYDALPELGHACGHCLSAAISVLAGLATAELQDDLDTDIHLIGTPCEETRGAKCDLVKSGVFDSYDMAMMVHLYNANLIAPKLQALAPFLYRFHGKSAHASSAPWEGSNALNAVQLTFHAVDMLRQHARPGAQFHGVIRDGGHAPNIVPEEASAEIFIRALDKYDLEELVRRVDDCARGAAIATQTTWDKQPTAAIYDNLNPNPTGLLTLAEIFEELSLPLNGDPDQIFGSSDIGNVSFVCPSFHPCLQVAGPPVALHSREFAAAMVTERAYTALSDGAKIIALQLAKIFGDPQRLQAMKDDFSASKLR